MSNILVSNNTPKNINNKSSYLKTLPNTVFLVIGISKNTQPNKLRIMYNNPAYYFLDIQNPKKESIIEEGRFIHCNLDNETELINICNYFNERFNIIFFDTGVIIHLRDMNTIIKNLLGMVKSGGCIIIPDLPFRSGIQHSMTREEYMSLTQNKKNILINKEKKNLRDQILESFKNIRIIPYDYKDIKSIFSNVYNTEWPSKYGFIIYKTP